MSETVDSALIDITKFHIPRWEELPNIALYLDQLVTLLEDYLANYIKDDNDKENKIITKTMINNYVKQGILDSPNGKKYNKTHIAKLFVICVLKQVYSINDINQLINLAIKTVPVEKAYNRFCTELESAIYTTFCVKPSNDKKKVTKEHYILINVVKSFANKLYVEKIFLKK